MGLPFVFSCTEKGVNCAGRWRPIAARTFDGESMMVMESCKLIEGELNISTRRDTTSQVAKLAPGLK